MPSKPGISTRDFSTLDPSDELNATELWIPLIRDVIPTSTIRVSHIL